MACNIPYLRNANLSETERDRLENIHVEIFQQASDSKVFRRVDNRFQTIKKEYPKATEFVGKINSQFGKPVAKIVPIGNGNSVLSVNVLPLSTEQQQNLFLQKPNVDYQLKSADILASQKAIDWFKKRDKGQWKGDLFWQKLQQDLQIPKEQIELLKSLNVENPYNREELLTSLLANYSYTIEINTAKKFIKSADDTLYDPITGTPISTVVDDNINTGYYSSLTVPGGTNYTENEIITPAITPSIKGHAQFSTDNGIGWFRSDDKYAFTGFLEDLLASGTIKKVPCG